MIARYKIVTAATAAAALLALGGTSFAAPAPAPAPSNFELTGFTASQTNTAGTYDLNVSVTQTSWDGSDGSLGSTSEFHAFPATIYLEIVGAGGTVVYPGPKGSLIAATLITSGTPGITYDKPGPGPSGSSSVSATAEYQVMLPKGVSLTSSEAFEIYSSSTPEDVHTFRMGPYTDSSWADDIVSGTTTMTIPAGQLPEVPLAAALPVLGLGVFALAWTRRRGRTSLS
jgi:hypothetical protein